MEKENQLLVQIFSFILVVFFAFLIGAILILLIGNNPIIGYYALFEGAFGSLYSFSETLVRATPILLATIGIIIPFKCKCINLGVEGQIYMGAIAAALASFNFQSYYGLHITLIALSSFLAGAFWAFFPGFLKAKFGINEILIGLMMNFIAIYFASYIVGGPLKDPNAIFHRTPIIPSTAQLPKIIPGTRLHAGFFIAIFCSILIYIILSKTTLGYKFKAVGSGQECALYGGIKVQNIIILSMVLGGGFAGLAGLGEVCGVHRYLLENISPGYGYLAFAVALLGKLNPLASIFASILFAALMVGAESMQRTTGIPVVLIYVIEGLVILSALCGGLSIRRKWRFLYA
ncbi:MAG: ABC transporter permease [Candidatus Bathyarchaeia archaeon]